MKNDIETKERLVASAKKEFLEKGFAQASLRNICKNAGVTTGALYFFFQNKEDLFASIVEQPLNALYEILGQHFAWELNLQNTQDAWGECDSEDFRIAKQMLHCMYQNYDEFQLLLMKARGSKYEHMEEQFVEIAEKQYRVIADTISLQNNGPRLEDYMIHWFAHTQVNLFVHLVSHEKAEESAMKHLEEMVGCLVACWNQLM